MKIAITSTSNDESKEMDSRFGRCKYFVIYNTENETYTFIENKSLNLEQGAGIASAQKVIDMNVDVLLTGKLGPKAKKVIDASNILTYFYEKGTVKEVLRQYLREH